MHPYTIRIFVPNGEPQGLKIIGEMNWTGCGLVFPRTDWQKVRTRSEFQQLGIYILSGYDPEESDDDDNEKRSIYIGQTDNLKDRIDSHDKEKDFWDTGLVFISTDNSLNRAHITWMEHKLIDLAQKHEISKVTNGQSPTEPSLSEHEKADTAVFLSYVLKMIPLVGIQDFEKPKRVVTTTASVVESTQSTTLDTIIVPARKKGFANVFLGENRWHAIRISPGRLNKIKYIAAYQTTPVSAITHVAKVAEIKLHGDSSKYQVIFSEPAEKINSIKPDDASSEAVQGTRYTSYSKLKVAKKMKDLWVK